MAHHGCLPQHFFCLDFIGLRWFDRILPILSGVRLSGLPFCEGDCSGCLDKYLAFVGFRVTRFYVIVLVSGLLYLPG